MPGKSWVNRLVGGRILFYVLILLYLAGLASGGNVCGYSALLVAVVPLVLVAALIIEALTEYDIYTATSGILLIALLILAKTVL